MIVQLQDLKVGVPVHVSEDIDPKAIELEFVDLKYANKVHLEGTLEKSLDALVFRGTIRSEIERTCARCLKVIKDPLDETFEFYYELKGQVEIDTTPDLREQLILEHPLNFICSANCKGLCPKCGLDLNEGSCQCASEIDRPLKASIRMVRKDNKEDSKNGKS